MPKQPADKIKSKDVRGLKYLGAMRPLLESLHDVGCQRDKAGNRRLHMDDYCMLVLLWLFSPQLTGLRAVQQTSKLEKVRRKFKIPRASLGSLSESVQVFDPEPLKRIAEELGQQIPDCLPIDSTCPKSRQLADVNRTRTITAVDGSVVKLLTQIAELAWIKIGDAPATCGYRLHTQFEILRGLPNRIDTTSANPKGENDERAVLERTLESDRLYVMDRGYVKWQLFNAIVDKKSSYVCRMRDKLKYRAVESRSLRDADRSAGVLSDEIIERTAAHQPESLNHPLRLVCVKCSPHTSRGRYSKGRYHSTAPSSDGVLRLLTNDLDLSAELIAEMYAQRWTIEITQAECVSRTHLYQLAA